MIKIQELRELSGFDVSLLRSWIPTHRHDDGEFVREGDLKRYLGTEFQLSQERLEEAELVAYCCDNVQEIGVLEDSLWQPRSPALVLGLITF